MTVENTVDLKTLVINFFLIANAIGNIPPIVALIKHFPFERQRVIVLREGIFALLISIGFQLVGKHFFGCLNIQGYAISIAGGMMLLLIALRMIFPSPELVEDDLPKREPFVVPIAIPLITGGGVMSVIAVYSTQVESGWIITLALVIAWMGVLPILMMAPYLKRILGDRGLFALEQLMGTLLALMSMRLVVEGLKAYFNGVH